MHQLGDNIVAVLQLRDGLDWSDARTQVDDFIIDVRRRIESGGDPLDMCEEHFGLEPDYIEEIIFSMC